MTKDIYCGPAMRKITTPQIFVFVAFFCGAGVLGVGTTWLLLGTIPSGDFRGISLVAAAIVLFYVYAITLYRGFLFFFPLTEGPVLERSKEEFIYHVYELFYLVLFHPLTRGRSVPVPLMRLIYLALGARMGANSYSGGTLLDPPLTVLGDNCIVGHDAVLFCHAVENESLSLAKISLGNNVTIGAKAVVMPGVCIGAVSYTHLALPTT